MSESEVSMVTAAMMTATHYLEYGCGHSTKLAAGVPSIKTITSVESDPAYIDSSLRTDEEIQRAIASERLKFLIVDIGPTGEWGRPLDRSKDYLWPNYALCPYQHSYLPDLILVDGRFRVACALVSALQAPAATILIHDYSIRPYYHLLERFLKIEARADTLVRCKALPDLDKMAARGLLKDYLYRSDDLTALGRFANKVKGKLAP